MRAELARDGAGSACINAECQTAFASKLAPTGIWGRAQDLCPLKIQCGSRACSRWRRVSLHQY
ncbi:hypothetical protein F7R20_19050 [Pseudomonas brassicacearum subsp. brassicacearum]|nr:hypothetical protein F7R20_19050 [Pseudomonas brassicacearum subsp. brassicacearum]PJH88606.1 hypothetical protein CVG87_13085 [Pseudomonas sp. WCS365]QEO80101.1 hypothetical protein ELZ14_22100 [Pseudomonas brassicacearum]